MELNTKILIADENVEQRNFLKENLFRAGYRHVDIALNGESAATTRMLPSSTSG